MVDSEPRDHVIHQLVASAQLARDELQALKTTALELPAATARTRIITRRHAAQAMTATGQQLADSRRPPLGGSADAIASPPSVSETRVPSPTAVSRPNGD